ncbi:MAG: c-type cytochrome, partial [Acidobacteria bacterium]|nr:c-type cytochrome [Acidobacteriota bacterium]NIM61435.1 c-type cytochrome [Acidobacteriota bacterium]NIO58098.1 c-type cytochrome [Acidobacteriota bacterium]NIQ29107.1 c-type cytochrome [Acidobacteriota bacterium]NIQ83651.1 c-type cytochrome [Acidobacteriota bacterium]
MESFTGPIIRLVTDPGRRMMFVVVLIAVPAVAAINVWAKMNVPLEAPAFGRTIHPAPPATITVHENDINLTTADNPYRHLETDDPEAFKAHVENGRRVYFQNCFYCHGDGLAGDGMFAHGLNPIPTNFTDQGIMPQLQESFLFWRISKGGPGMPEEGGPWDSAMPAWENFLTEEEMWDVVMFLADFTGYTARARSEHSDGGH